MICPGAPDGRDSPAHRHHPSPPSDSDLFNFFFITPSAPSKMCAFDEIFSRGKLLPFGAPPPPPKKSETHKPNGLLGDHRRGNSFDRIPKEYRKLRKIPESGPEESAARSRSRTMWYVFVFGSVRVPATMERRRSAKTAEDANWWGRGYWKLLRSLSSSPRHR